MRHTTAAVPRPSAFFLLLALLAAGLPGFGQVTFTGGVTDFGTVNVGTSSVSTLMFQFSQTFSLGQLPAVVTQGQFNADFTLTGGSCAPGTYYSGNSCTVQVTFTPAYPGIRMGAVMFVSQTGAIVSTIHLRGVGSGSLPPGTGTVTTTNTTVAPNALAVDAKENVYLAGFYGVYTMDGTALGGGAKATTAAAIDGAGNIYVADPLSNCVWMTTPVLPLGGSGQTSRSTQCLNTPSGVQIGHPLTVDAWGYVYVADTASGNVVMFNANGSGATVAACGYGTCLDSYTGQVSALALDASGNLYVGTPQGGTCFWAFALNYVCNGAVWKVTPANAMNPTAWTAVWQGTGVGAYSVRHASSLAVDAAGTVYVTDGLELDKVPQGSPQVAINAAAAGLANWRPQWVTVDQAGNGWVADTVNSKVYELANANALAVLSPVNGQCGPADGQTVPAPPSLPGDLCTAGTASAVQGSGPWYWSCAGIQDGTTASCTANAPAASVPGQCGAANGATLSTTPTTGLCSSGNPLPVLGAGPWTWGCSGLNGGGSVACSASLGSGVVNGACGAANGGSFSAAPASGLCSVGTPSPSALSGSGPWSWTCTGANGSASCAANPASAACATGTVTTMTASHPGIKGLGLDSYGNLYVGWKNNNAGGIARLHGGVWEPNYYYDPSLMSMAVNASGWILYTEIAIAWMAPPGSTDFTGYMSNLGDIAIRASAVDPAGNGYVSPTTSGVHTIAKISPGGIATYAGGGTVCASATDSVGDGCPATSAVIASQTFNMTSDPYGNIYFADDSGRFVRRVDHQTGIVTRVAGSIAGGGLGDGGPATNAAVATVEGLAVDDAGDIFISQYPRNVVRRVDGATGIITTLVIPHVATPGALALDGQGKLYVADLNTSAITGVSNLSGSSTNCQAPAPAAGVCGAANGATLTSAPTLATDLCSAGTPYPAAGSGPWTWYCAGLNNGSVASCSAQAAVMLPQTISFPNPGTQTYGVAPITLGATATSSLDVTYSVTSGPAWVSGSTLVITDAGLVTVQASQAGNTSWQAATPVSVTFTVNPTQLTATAVNSSMYQGSTLPSPLTTVSYSGFVNGDTAEVVQGSAALSTTATSSSPPGNYPIVISQGTLSAADYTFRFVNGLLSVLAPPKAQLSISAALALQASGYQATLTITNSGNADAANVVLATATLGAAAGSPLPQTVGTVKAGHSATVTVTFPLSAGADGASVVAKFTGTYTGGTFSSSIREVLP